MKSPSPTRPRPSKRVKLDSSSPSPSSTPKHAIDDEGVELVEGDHCSICLQQLVDRTVIPTCSHEFCFECILVWTGQYSLVFLVIYVFKFIFLQHRTIPSLPTLLTTHK